MVMALLAGWIAKRILKRRQSIMACLGLGLWGAMLGNWVATALSINFQGIIGGLLLACAGAVMSLAIVATLRPDR